MDLGNLQLGIQVGGLDLLDRLERQMVALENRFGPPLTVDVNTSSAQRSLDEYVRVTGTAISSNRALSESEMQLARDLQAAAASRQSVVALERIAATERVQIARNAAAQETAIERERIRQTEQNARQREQIEARAAQTIYQEQQRAARQQAGGGSGSGGYFSGRSAIGQAFGGGVAGFAIGSAAVAGGSLLTSGLVAATKASVDLNSQLQSSQLAFATFLGSTEAADAHIRDLARFAATTPFQFPDLLEASKRLQSMGFSAQSIIPDLTAVGNAVAAMGTGKEGIDRITLALGQMQQKGKVSGEELRQLAEAGINATAYIAQALGKTQAETLALSQRGEISGTTGVSAIISGLANDPKFAGLMDKQSRSFAGAMSNIQDSAQMAVATGLRPLFDSLNDDANALAKFTASDSFTKGAADFAVALHDDIDAMKEMVTVAKDLGDTPFIGFLRSMANTYNPFNLIGGLSDMVTGNSAARAQAQAGAAGQSDMDVAMKRVVENQRLLDLQAESSRKVLGISNPIESAQRARDIQQAKETVAEYDKILAARQQQQYEAGRFVGPVDLRDVNGISPEEQKQLDADAKTAADNMAAYQKQMYADIVASAQKGAADIANAWKSAAAEVANIDIGKGILSLADASAPLHQVMTDLANLGQAAPASLAGLSRIADEFASITSSEKAASVAFDAYMNQLSESDVRIQKLTALRKNFDDAAKASPVGSDLRTNQTAVDANIDAQIARIRTGQATDLMAAVKVVPDWADFDAQMRAKTLELGGAPQVSLTVNALTEKAKADIHAIEINPWSANLTVHVQYVTPDGKAIDPALIDNPGGGAYTVASNGGYARPTTIRSVGSGPYGNDTLVQGGVGGASTVTPRGDASNLLPYASVIQKAADAYGVPAWMLGAIIMHESGGVPGAIEQGGGLGRGLTQVDLGQHPDQYAHQAELTGTDAASIAYQINEGAKILAAALAASGGNPQGYAGSAYRSQAGGGVSAGLDFGTELSNYYRSPVQAALSGGGGATTGGVRDQIIALALQSVGVEKLVNYCEQFVEETVQAITGKRGATGMNETNATAAFRHAQSMGLETKNPQPGDLVYYPDANGGPGHVAVYQGRGQQISTADVGGTAIHTEVVGPGARYVSIGAPDSTGGTLPHGASYAQSERGQAVSAASGNTLDLSDPNTPAAQRALAQQKADADDLATALSNVKVATEQVNRAFAGMDSRDIGAALSELQQMQPVLEKIALAKLPDTASDADKQIATNAALGQTLELTAVWGTALSDIRNHTGNIAADQQRITDIVGGPLAAGLNRELQIYDDQARIADRITQLTQRKKDLEAQHAQILQQRQTEDTAASRAQTRQGWADQDIDNALARRRRGEDTRFTGVSRGFEDRSRTLAFSQQLAATDLQNRLIDLQKSQQSGIYQRTSQEQLLSAQAAGAGTNQEAAALAARLAGMHDQDLAQRDLNTKAIDDIQLQIREQSRAANLESYNLESERIAAQRNHEDILAGLDAEGQRNAEMRQARDRSHQQDLWNIEDARQAEDARYAAAQTALDNEITAQQTLATQADAALKSAQDALTVWQQTGVEVATVGQNFGAAVSNATTSSTLPGWSPTPIRTLGGSGEAQTIAPAAPASGGQGATINLNLGDLNMALSEQDKEDIRNYVQEKVRAAQKAGMVRKGALGL